MIGSHDVGMGHIYRTMSVADEFKEHEVFFLSDHGSDLAISYYSGMPGWLGAFSESEIVAQIVSCKPDLVILDSLDTDESEIVPLRERGFMVVSFEDLGSGSTHTTLTINELFDVPELEGENYRWGKEFFFVRDEFLVVSPREKPKKIENVLLTFGGVDQHNLSQKVLLQIRNFCSERGIQVHIVTGPGYREGESLSGIVNESTGVHLTHATGVISRIMAEADLAISSNGRTVYELAHMNVPGIVIDQHAREGTHHFASPENGFINIGLYNPGETESSALRVLSGLVTDIRKYGELYDRTKRHKFTKAKSRTIRELKSLLD